MNKKQLMKTAENTPENLLFYSTDELREGIEKRNRITADCFYAIAAELLVRYYFAPSNDGLRSLLLSFLPEQALNGFDYWRKHLSSCFPRIDGRGTQLFLSSWNVDAILDADIAEIEKAAISRFTRLFERCAGIIPVQYSDHGDERGVPIPFYLEDVRDSESSTDGALQRETVVVDLSGKQIDSWTKAVSALRLPIGRVRLGFYADSAPVDCFAGASLQLPVLFAFWRQQELLPQYNPFKVIATGAITREGRLDSVDVKTKYEDLSKRFDNLV